MKRWLSFGFTACLALAGLHCSSESGDGTGGSSATGATSVSKEITAAEGGTVEAKGATIAIPAGALSEDTTITVEVTAAGSEPDAASIASSVYALGPDGTVFLKPVTLTFEFTGTAPEGKTARIAYLEGGAWKALGDSAVSGGSVVATTTHFSTYAVVWMAGGGAGGCDALQFDACGGALEGEWDFTDVCFEFTKGPLDSCPGATLSLTLDYTVAATFGADATFSFIGTSTSESTLFIPASCIGPNCGDDYTDAPGGCAKIEAKEQEVAQTGTYAASANTVTLTLSGGEKVYEYCVSGDTASLRSVPGPDETSFSILKLQRK